MMFRLSGVVGVEYGEAHIPIESPPVSGILAALLFEEGRLVHSDGLVEALWDAPPQSAHSNVRLYLSRLRRQLAAIDPSLGARLVTRRGSGYAVKAGEDETDLTRFRQLTVRGGWELRDGYVDLAAATLGEALALWRGPVGQGARRPDSSGRGSGRGTTSAWPYASAICTPESSRATRPISCQNCTTSSVPHRFVRRRGRTSSGPST